MVHLSIVFLLLFFIFLIFYLLLLNLYFYIAEKNVFHFTYFFLDGKRET